MPNFRHWTGCQYCIVGSKSIGHLDCELSPKRPLIGSLQVRIIMPLILSIGRAVRSGFSPTGIHSLDTLGVSPSVVHWLYWMELCLRRIGAYRSTRRSSEGTTPPLQATRRAGISCRFSFAWKTAILGSTYFHVNENPSRTAPCTAEGLTPSLSSILTTI